MLLAYSRVSLTPRERVPRVADRGMLGATPGRREIKYLPWTNRPEKATPLSNPYNGLLRIIWSRGRVLVLYASAGAYRRDGGG